MKKTRKKWLFDISMPEGLELAIRDSGWKFKPWLTRSRMPVPLGPKFLDLYERFRDLGGKPFPHPHLGMFIGVTPSLSITGDPNDPPHLLRFPRPIFQSGKIKVLPPKLMFAKEAKLNYRQKESPLCYKFQFDIYGTTHRINALDMIAFTFLGSDQLAQPKPKNQDWLDCHIENIQITGMTADMRARNQGLRQHQYERWAFENCLLKEEAVSGEFFLSVLDGSVMNPAHLEFEMLAQTVSGHWHAIQSAIEVQLPNVPQLRNASQKDKDRAVKYLTIQLFAWKAKFFRMMGLTKYKDEAIEDLGLDVSTMKGLERAMDESAAAYEALMQPPEDPGEEDDLEPEPEEESNLIPEKESSGNNSEPDQFLPGPSEPKPPEPEIPEEEQT